MIARLEWGEIETLHLPYGYFKSYPRCVQTTPAGHALPERSC